MSDATENLLPDALLPEMYQKRQGAPTKRYHVGLYPNGPSWNLTLAGISFPVTTSAFDANDNEIRKEGAIVELTAEQCKKIRDAIAMRIVRWQYYPKGHKREGERMAAQVWSTEVRGFEPEKGDEPLVKYVFFKAAPPEFTAPPPAASAFAELDRAIREAEETEAQRRTDPEDAATRAKHGALKKAGAKLGDSAGAL